MSSKRRAPPTRARGGSRSGAGRTPRRLTCIDALTGVRSAKRELVVVLTRTARGLLVAGLLLGLGTSVFVATAFAATDLRGAAGSDQRTVKDGGTLVLGTREFDSIDPALARPPDTFYPFAYALWPVEDATCALLLRYPAGPPPVVRYRQVPEVAAALPDVSPDGRTYTFTIRKGYKFSTGAQVKAANYAREMNRILSPAMQSPAAEYLKEVVGATAVRSGKAPTASGIRAAGHRLIIRLRKRVSDFPARMTMPYFCPVPTD